MKNFFLKIIIFMMVLFMSTQPNETIGSINDKVIINNFKNITIEEGLSQSTVNCIFQDSNGYIWIGTSDGLNKYNAHKFEMYRSKNGDSNTISGNTIVDIKEDNKGNIWVGTTIGLNKIDAKTKKIKRYIPNENGCNISNRRIRDILVSKNGEILIATDDGLNKYDEKNDNFVRIYNDTSGDILSNQEVYSVIEDNSGDYWVGTRNGLNKIDNKTGKLTTYYHDKFNENTISHNFIYKLYSDESGYLWVGTYYGGLNKIDFSNNTVERYMPTGSDADIPGSVIKDILRDNKGQIWIATENGLANFDEENKIFKTWKSEYGDNDSIVSNDINSLIEDKMGMIWIGTSEGISIFNPNNKFINYKKNYLNENSLSDNLISGIYEDEDGLLWVGTIFNGLNVIDREKNTVTRIDHTKEDGENLVISNNLVRDITGKENEIWIATQNGLDRYDKITNTITKFKDRDGLTTNDVLSLFIDKSETLWIGTFNGLCSYDKSGSFRNYNEELKKIGIENTPIRDIYVDKDNDIWISLGNGKGLVKYSKGEFTKYNLNDENNKEYGSILCITSNNDKYIWLGTDHGLIKLNKENGRYTIYSEEQGLANSFIYGILFDSNGNPWLSSNYGISKFDLKEDKFINFDFTDGIQSNEFNEYAYHKGESGEFFFGGIKGLTAFIPEDIKAKNLVPKVQIENIEVGYDKIEIQKEISLKYNENQIRLDFFMPDYSTPMKLQYSYRLVGLDKEWVLADNRNYASYTNLYPGSYRFEVCGRNSSGEWSEPTYVNINISTPPWRSPIAYFIYFLGIVVLIYIIWNRVKLLDDLVKQRTLELDKKLVENEQLYEKLLYEEKYKNNYFVNLSHELRTPLNLIVSTQQLIDNLNSRRPHIPKDKISHYMSTISRNSNRLLNLIDNIIYTSKIEAGNYKLNIKRYDIVYLVEEIALSMRDYIEEKGIELVVDPEIEEKVIECDNHDIEKIILNLMSNAAKFTDKGGTIEVKICDLSDYVKIVVRDDGIGIDKSKHEAIFNRFGQAYNSTTEEYGGSGLGLTLTKQLVELHGGKISINSSLGKGSEFIVILPIKQQLIRR